MSIDFNAEADAIGHRSPYINKNIWDGEKYRSEPIEDIELAHEMALAMDSHMEKVIAFNNLYNQLEQDPEATFRRAGRKAVLFAGLVETQKAEDDKDGRQHRLGYKPVVDIGEYIQQKNKSYIRDQKRSVVSAPEHNRITNGFVGTFVLKAIERHQEAADKAGALVFFKQRTRENITVYEQHLSKKDQQVFAGIKSREERNNEWFEGDEEAIELSTRANELWDIFRKKLVVQAVAQTFGRKSLRGFSREDAEELASVVSEDGYMIRA